MIYLVIYRDGDVLLGAIVEADTAELAGSTRPGALRVDGPFMDRAEAFDYAAKRLAERQRSQE